VFFSKPSRYLPVIATGFDPESRSSPSSLNGPQLISRNAPDMLCLVCCRWGASLGLNGAAGKFYPISIHASKES